MALTKEKKKSLVDEFKAHEKDTGNPAIQIGLITERIAQLTGHLKECPKDYASRQGLFKLVAERKQFLIYLKRTDPEGYQKIIQRFDLRK